MTSGMPDKRVICATVWKQYIYSFEHCVAYDICQRVFPETECRRCRDGNGFWTQREHLVIA